MMNTDLREHLLSIPTRQSPIAIFLIVQSLLRQLVRQFWPILLVVLLNYFNFQASSPREDQYPYMTTVFFAIAALSTIGSIIAYFKFYYYIKDDEFIIEKGIFQKTKINLPFDRIQTINFEQNLIHQAFNVVRFEVDSAGSSGKEISLQAIRREDAEFIRSYILAEKAKQVAQSAKVSQEETPTRLSTVDKGELLMQHTPKDLFKIGVSENHLRGLAAILGFGFWILQSVEDFIPQMKEGDNPVDYLEKDLGIGYIISFWVYLILALIVFSIIISLILTAFRYFDLQFIRTKVGFKVIAGLFTKREQSANINKIQIIRWQDSILKRLFGIFRLQLYQASSQTVNINRSISVPGCYAPQINTVRQTYFPEEVNNEYETHRISPLIIGRRVLYLGGIPASIIALVAYLNDTPLNAIWSIVWLSFIFLTSRIFYQNWKFHLSKEGLLTENGLLGTNFTLLKWYKVQSVKIRQSIYQRRKRVADIYFYTAAGSVKIPYIPLEKALAIKNYVLYKVESDKRAWM